eukprot:4750061-Prorocentrum_lima.AAC.1
MNTKKSNVMISWARKGRRQQEEKKNNIAEYDEEDLGRVEGIKVVRSGRWLGIRLNKEMDQDREVEDRSRKARKAPWSIKTSRLKDRGITIETRWKVMEAMVRS